MSGPAHPPSAHSEITPGTILAAKYRVERILGRGGMGVVVEARHLQLDERVALKFLTPEWATHPEAAERFLREARAAVRIKNEHVARVSDVGTLETGSPYMVMEYLEGTDLSQLLEKHGPMRLDDAVDYLVQGCEAIAEAHGMGIVHRDLKPANLFLTKHPDGSPLVKVLDFGISKSSGQGVDNLTRTTATMGSALYMSPEQMQQSRNVDHRTDVYALGVSLYELLAGKQPYYAETLPQLCAEILTGTPTPLRELRPDISVEFANVLERAYARDRNVRFQNVAEFVFALAPFALPRTQGSIDRVARLAGQQPPRAGAPPVGGFAPGPHGGGPNDGRLVVGPYAGAPPSARAAAAFAQQPAGGHPSQPDFGGQLLGGPHGAGPHGAGPHGAGQQHPGYQSSGSFGSHELGAAPPAKSKAPLVVAAFAAAVLGGVAAFFLLGGSGAKSPTPDAASSAPAVAPSVTASPTTEAKPATTAEPSTSAEPTPPTSASAPAATSAEAPASAAASVAPPPRVPADPRRPPAAPPSKPPTTSAAATPPPPPPTQPKKDLFGDR